jgi:hypothetical protein
VAIQYSSLTELQSCFDLDGMLDVVGHIYKCSKCRTDAGSPKTFRTTAPEFWKRFKFKDLPRWVPAIFSRSMFTNRFVHMIRTYRLDSTHHGLAANITQQHIKQYLDYKKAYYLALGSTITSIEYCFSSINDKKEYDWASWIAEIAQQTLVGWRILSNILIAFKIHSLAA